MRAEIKLASRLTQRFRCRKILAIGVVLIPSLASGVTATTIHTTPSSLVAFNLNAEETRQPRPLASAVPARPSATSKLLRKIGSQTVDQSLHFVMAAGPIWASRYLAGVPWYGWLIAPVLAYREWTQWPSKRWWDPPLDWSFLTLGVLVATWWPARRRTPRAGIAKHRSSIA